MPNQGQTLDQIFSTQAPTSPTASTGGGNAPAQSLESIFGNTKTQSVKPSLDSIFNAKPTPQGDPNAIKIGDATLVGGPVGGAIKNVAGAVSDTASNIMKDVNANTEEAGNIATNGGTTKPSALDTIGPTLLGAGKDVVNIGGDVVKGAGSALIGILSPFIPQTIKDAYKGMGKEAMDGIAAAWNTPATTPEEQAGKDQVHGFINAITQVAKDNPEVAKTISDALATVLAPSGIEGGINLAKGAISKAGDIASNVVDTAKTPISDAIGTVANKASDVASNIKEKIAPSATLDQTVGQVAQGSADEIPKFTKGLSNLDTSGVKTYEDLSKTAGDTIKTEAKAQDTALASNDTPLKVQQMAIKVGTQEAAHNYVLDAVKQLKDYFTKTNDIGNLAKVNEYITKLDPLKGEGLTVKEINDIARMHSTNLNAYNANGELASGLAKQAAENTRQGLKQTVVQNIKDPAMQAAFKASDAKMSSLYTVRDLSGKMAQKVNTLTQRLQKPNILQKIGSIIGQVGRISGVGDLAQKLIGIEKVPGASTLNAVELEARLAKNLAKINEALGKDDAGFTKDIEKLIQDDHLSNSKANATKTTNNTTNQKANVGDKAQSMKNKSNQTMK